VGFKKKTGWVFLGQPCLEPTYRHSSRFKPATPPQDDCTVLSARSEVEALDHMIDQQQRQFAEQTFAAADVLDPAIPVTFTKVKRQALS